MNRHSGPNLDPQLDITVRGLLAIFLLHVRLPQQEYAKTDLMGNLFISSTVGQYRKDLPSSNSLVRDAKVSEISTMVTMRTRIRSMAGNQTAEM